MDEVLPVSVTVLLPTRNEEEALGATVDAIPRDWCESLERVFPMPDCCVEKLDSILLDSVLVS